MTDNKKWDVMSMKQCGIILGGISLLFLSVLYITNLNLGHGELKLTHMIMARKGCLDKSCFSKFGERNVSTRTTGIKLKPVLTTTRIPLVKDQTTSTNSFDYTILSTMVATKSVESTTETSQFHSTATTTTVCPKNNKSWDFNCYNFCPNLSLTQRHKHRWQLVISCEEMKMTMEKMSAQNSLTVPTVFFNTSCLESALESICASEYVVPNVVHYVWFNRRKMSFYHFISFISAHKFLKPCLILIHGDYQPYGIYWEYLLQIIPNIIHVYRDPPSSIYGNHIQKVEHKSDVARLQALQLYGGYYIDTDEIILRPMDELRNYTFTLSHELDSNLANGLIVSAKNAPFLSVWLNGYRKFHNDQWAYFSTILPYELSKKFPDFIHIEDKTFVKPDYTQIPLFLKHNFNWSHNYAIHLYTRFYNGKTYNLQSIRRLNTTIGSISRHVIFGSKELCFA